MQNFLLKHLDRRNYFHDGFRYLVIKDPSHTAGVLGRKLVFAYGTGTATGPTGGTAVTGTKGTPGNPAKPVNSGTQGITRS